MKILVRLLALVFLVAGCSVEMIAQVPPTGDSLDYFPYRAGDSWRLRRTDLPDDPPRTYTIVRDSVDSSGNIWLFLLDGGWISSTGELLIDTAGNVYSDPRTSYRHHPYSLRAKVGDRWRGEADTVFNGNVYITCTGIYTVTVFGQPVIVKEFQRWIDFSGDGGPDSSWRTTYRLGRGLGQIDEFHEPSTYFYLSGASIGGHLYGEPIVGVTEPLASRSALLITPNPFTSGATITYRLDDRCHVRLTILDALGRVVFTPVDEVQSAGDHAATLDGTDLPDGAYIYQLRTPSRITSGTLIRRR